MEEVIIDDGNMTEKQQVKFVEQVEQMATAAAMEAAAQEEAQENIKSGILTSEQFEKHFIELFDICGDLWDMPEFKLNRDKPFEVAGAKVSAAKLYLMAQKYQMLHFLIEPAGGWFGDTIAIACFVGAKANVACRRFAKRSLLDYVKHATHLFWKKSGETTQKDGFFSKFFSKGGKDEETK